MGAKRMVFLGAIKALDEWYEVAMDHYASMVVDDGKTAFDCCLEVAQDIGAWRHKASALLGMGLVEEEQYDKLMKYCDGLMSKAGDYICDLEEGRDMDADKCKAYACD